MNFLVGDFFRFDALSSPTAGLVVFFGMMVFVYSLGYMRGRSNLFAYYIYLFMTIATGVCIVLANNILVLLLAWGFFGVVLFLLINFGQKAGTSATAKKALIMVCGTDVFMLMALGLLWRITGTYEMHKIHLALDNRDGVIVFFALVAAIFAKAGAVPFHTWVPDTAENAPVSVTTLLPASIDKLVGIYLLVRISTGIFTLPGWVNMTMMLLGALTIMCGVMMALVQHDLKRLLGYHAVSQTGYMILGIGTGNPIGIAGGLFHMLNHAIYKSALFMSAGAVEKKCGTTDLDKLGALSKAMPITFGVFLIGTFAISGVSPLNGFVSKWMVYQGVIETGMYGKSGILWIVCLLAGMFGSALTLASFLKVINAVFMGQPSQEVQRSANVGGDGSPFLWLPGVLLAALCVLFGVLPRLPIDFYIAPGIGMELSASGYWEPAMATILMLAGIVIGFLIYLLGTFSKIRESDPFVGGADLAKNPAMRVSGTDFYNTIKNIAPLRVIYGMADKKWFDVYEVGRKATLAVSKVLRDWHNGVLPSYLAWCLLGMSILFWVLILR